MSGSTDVNGFFFCLFLKKKNFFVGTQIKGAQNGIIMCLVSGQHRKLHHESAGVVI